MELPLRDSALPSARPCSPFVSDPHLDARPVFTSNTTANDALPVTHPTFPNTDILPAMFNNGLVLHDRLVHDPDVGNAATPNTTHDATLSADATTNYYPYFNDEINDATIITTITTTSSSVHSSALAMAPATPRACTGYPDCTGLHPRSSSAKEGASLLEAVHLMFPQAWWMACDISQHMQPLSVRYGVTFHIISNLQSTATVQIRGNAYGIEPAAADLAHRIESDLRGNYSFGPTQTLEAALPREMVSIIIGRGGEKIQRINNESGCSIMIQQLSLYCGLVIFQGTVSSILKAQVLVERQLNSISRRQGLTGGVLIDVSVARQLPVQTATVPMSAALLSSLPYLFQDIQTKSGAEVTSSPDPTNPATAHVYLQGLSGQVKLGIELLMLQSDSRPAGQHGGTGARSSPSQQSFGALRVTRTFSFPSYLTALVVGRKGYAVKQLQQQSGAAIHIPKMQDKAESDDIEAVIVGDSSQVETCLRLLKDKVDYLIAQGHSKVPPFTHETMAIDESKIGLLIGKKGATIRLMQLLSGARITLTGNVVTSVDGGSSSSNDTSRDQISPISCITSSTADLSLSPHVRTSDSPVRLALSSSDLDSSGDDVRTMHDCSFGAQQPHQQPHQQMVQIRGSQEQLEYAKMLIRRHTSSKQDAQLCLEEELRLGYARRVPIPENKVGLIIGAEGNTLRTLEQTYSVALQLPPPDGHATTRPITVMGMPDKVNQCCERIDQIISKSDGASIPQGHIRKVLHIPFADVGGVIGKNGSTIRQLQLETNTHLNVETELEVPASSLRDNFTLAPSGSTPNAKGTTSSGDGRDDDEERGVCDGGESDYDDHQTAVMTGSNTHSPTTATMPSPTASSPAVKESTAQTGLAEEAASPTAKETHAQAMVKVKEIALVGPAEGVAELERFISNLIAVRHLKLDGPKAGVRRNIFIDESQVGIVIGKHGSRVQSLQAHTGCEINVTQEEHVYVDAQGNRKVQRLIELRAREVDVVDACEKMLKEMAPIPVSIPSGYFMGVPSIPSPYSMQPYMGSPQL
ncbi:hypothetical protein PTSG_02310 [Salpingoeca rosetta]|uniref:K Homology domain-containing protein n=1 Tax=Salpingoeca rosetta (strain ATCC 50818 / BSB-021) TaxID=946362 RepID=F2U1U3_SALR5|nr:uncharacterized protein PTSG_02310 [Salpingoeca rosetta]EGD81595.1 hypothetical protein PTSG_02310 [Salpingoeca rosetta]|eukprot:XP_004996799.1 hypothetical protein PTSG_02310 [Salpingoeca rosetta]